MLFDGECDNNTMINKYVLNHFDCDEVNFI